MRSKLTVNKWVTTELPAIMVSLIAAVLLWSFNQLRYTQERTFQVEPTVKISDWMIPLKEPKLVTVTVKGDAEQLRNVDPNDFSIILDLSFVDSEGEHEGFFSLEKKGVAKHLKGLEVSLNPVSLRLYIEKKITKAVPVKIKTSSQVRSGYEIEVGVSSPDTISVSGPRSQIEKLEFIETEMINLEELTHNMEMQERSFIIDKTVRLSQDNVESGIIYNRAQEIFCSFRVQEIIKQITVKDLYVNQVGTDPNLNYQLSTDLVDLQLSGPEIILNKLNVNALVLGVDLDHISRPGKYKVPIVRMYDPKQIEGLHRVTDLGLFPAEVEVTVSAK